MHFIPFLCPNASRIILNITRRTKTSAAVHCSFEFPGPRHSQYTDHLAQMALFAYGHPIHRFRSHLFAHHYHPIGFGSFGRSGIAYAENLREILAITIAILLAKSTMVCIGRIGKHTVKSHNREDENQRQDQDDDRIDLQPRRFIGVKACHTCSLAK